MYINNLIFVALNFLSKSNLIVIHKEAVVYLFLHSISFELIFAYSQNLFIAPREKKISYYFGWYG